MLVLLVTAPSPKVRTMKRDKNRSRKLPIYCSKTCTLHKSYRRWWQYIHIFSWERNVIALSEMAMASRTTNNDCLKNHREMSHSMRAKRVWFFFLISHRSHSFRFIDLARFARIQNCQMRLFFSEFQLLCKQTCGCANQRNSALFCSDSLHDL